MTHSLDFVGISNKLYFLRHLVTGNREVSRREQIYQGTKSDPSTDWEEEEGRLRAFVSTTLVECAAKMRVILDAAAEQMDADDLRSIEQRNRSAKIGSVLVGSFDLSVRESCNKIIHATYFELAFENARNTRPRYNYSFWNGICRCSGTYSKKPWRVAINVYGWADAMEGYLFELAHELEW